MIDVEGKLARGDQEHVGGGAGGHGHETAGFFAAAEEGHAQETDIGVGRQDDGVDVLGLDTADLDLVQNDRLRLDDGAIGQLATDGLGATYVDAEGLCLFLGELDAGGAGVEK